MATTRDILNAIADEKALALFDTIAIAEYDSEMLINKLGLSRKEYYIEDIPFDEGGLASRKRGKYSLTLLGKIVYQAQLTIDHAVNIYPKLKAVDLLEKSYDIPEEERSKVISFLLGNDPIKNILLQKSCSQD